MPVQDLATRAMIGCIKVYTLLLIAAHSLVGGQGSSDHLPYNGWTQQYGDPSSSSYTQYTGDGFKPGWNFTTQPFVSQTSPCVDQYGVIYYPLRANIVAIAPSGAVKWKASVSPNGNSYLTNVLFSNRHSFVIVGSSWVEQETFFQIVALYVNNGSVAWTSTQNELYHATTMSISVNADAVYVAGYDLKSFAAVSLVDGKLIWKKANIYQVGIFMQTKVGPSVVRYPTGRGVVEERMTKGGRESQQEVVLLPTDPWDGFEGKGRLFAYNSGKSERTDYYQRVCMYIYLHQFTTSTVSLVQQAAIFNCPAVRGYSYCSPHICTTPCSIN